MTEFRANIEFRKSLSLSIVGKINQNGKTFTFFFARRHLPNLKGIIHVHMWTA